MKFLFVISHALYIRHFESVLRQLANSGHTINVALTDSKPVQENLLQILDSEFSNLNVLVTPHRSGWWWPASAAFRAVRDYLRYFEPRYSNSPNLFQRGARRIPRPLRFLLEKLGLGHVESIRGLMDYSLRAIERCIPADPALLNWLEEQRPDAVIITPLVDHSYSQLDVLKAGTSIGIFTAFAVASWDNLTSKGIVQFEPHLVLVWNETQRREAIILHKLAAPTIKVVGAQLYDQWFDMVPEQSREEVCTSLGDLDPAKPIILFLGSSHFIAPDEVEVVRRWIAALRQHTDQDLRDANVIVRPHPMNAQQWQDADIDQPGRLVVHPRGGTFPHSEKQKREYFETLFHADVVVGINTSGFLEAGILGRPCLSIPDQRVSNSQEGTLHFHYLVEGTLVQPSESLEEHFELLRQVLPFTQNTEAKKFVEQFIRPHGLTTPATPLFCQTVCDFAEKPWSARPKLPLGSFVLRYSIVPIAYFIRRAYFAYTGATANHDPRHYSKKSQK